MSNNMEQTNQNPQNNQQQFVCTGDCRKCRSMQQWSYCASIHAYSNMKVLDKIMETLLGMKSQIETMQGTVAELSAKIEAIENGEAAVFDPNGEGKLFPEEFAKKDIAQEEDGAENRSSKK